MMSNRNSSNGGLRVAALSQRDQLRAMQLAGKKSPADSLESLPDFSSATITALRFGSETGTLPAVYAELLAAPPIDGTWWWSSESVPRQMVRTAMGFMFMALILTFLVIFIVPTFIQMFDEFDLIIPFPSLYDVAPTISGLLTTLATLSLLASLIWLSTGWMVGSTSIGKADALTLLAIAVEAGRPLGSAIQPLANHMPPTRVGRGLKRALVEAADGVEPIAALQHAGLLPRSYVTAAPMIGDGWATAWMLRWAAEQSAASRHASGSLALRLVSITLKLVVALIIAVIAVAVMAALASLVMGLA